MRLTNELIQSAPVYMNPLKQREINLRGFKIPHIENLGVTNNEYEVIDLCDNEIAKLENIPLLPRLNMLLLANNRINKLALELHQNTPNLDSLILSYNRLSTLSDLDPLACLTSLRTLSLMHNPVAKQSDYRSYVIHLLPNLRLLDFAKVKPAEREAALLQFGPPPTAESMRQATLEAMATPAAPEKVAPGQAVPMGQAISLNSSYSLPSSYAAAKPPKLSAEDLAAEKKKLVEQIASASNLEQVNALQKQLETLIANNA